MSKISKNVMALAALCATLAQPAQAIKFADNINLRGGGWFWSSEEEKKDEKKDGTQKPKLLSKAEGSKKMMEECPIPVLKGYLQNPISGKNLANNVTFTVPVRGEMAHDKTSMIALSKGQTDDEGVAWFYDLKWFNEKNEQLQDAGGWSSPNYGDGVYKRFGIATNMGIEYNIAEYTEIKSGQITRFWIKLEDPPKGFEPAAGGAKGFPAWVIAAIVGVLLLIIVGCYCLCCRKKKEDY